MDCSNNIIPWTCSVCGEEYGEKEGGLCRRCQGVACNKHLRYVIMDDNGSGKGTKMLVCINCVREGEKVKRARLFTIIEKYDF